MEDKELDRIFKESLERQRDFGGQETQWKLLASELETTNARRIWWLPLMLGFAVLAGLGYWWMNTESQELAHVNESNISVEKEVKIEGAEVLVEESVLDSRLVDKELANDQAKGKSRIQSGVSKSKTSKLDAFADGSRNDIGLEINDLKSNATYTVRANDYTKISGDTGNNEGANKRILDDSTSDYMGSEPKNAYSAEPYGNQLESDPKPLSTTSDEDVTSKNLSFFLVPSLKLGQLPLKDIGFQGLSYNSYGPSLTMSKPERNFNPRSGFIAGLRYTSASNSSFEEKGNLSSQIGIYYRLHKRWSTSLRMNRRAIDRTFISDFEKYDLLVDTLDYSAFSLIDVRQKAVQWNGELELAYVFLDRKRFQIAVHQGVQSRWQRQEIRKSRLESVYQYREVSVPIDASFQFGSNFYSGINTKVAFTSRVGLAIDYHYQYSLFNSTIKWPAQHVVDAGIYYTIK